MAEDTGSVDVQQPAQTTQPLTPVAQPPAPTQLPAEAIPFQPTEPVRNNYIGILDPALKNKLIQSDSDYLSKNQDELTNALKAYKDAQGGNLVAPQTDQGSISTYKEPSILEKTLFTLKSGLTGVTHTGGELKKGIQQISEDMQSGFLHMGEAMRGDSPEQRAANQQALTNTQQINSGTPNDAYQQALPGGLSNPFNLNKEYVENGDPSHPVASMAMGAGKFASSVIAAGGTGGATFALQGIGSAANTVEKMKEKGVKFENGSDKLFIYGSGLINFGLAKGLGHVLLGDAEKKLTDDVISSLSADVTKELADKGGAVSAEEIGQAYFTKGLEFGQRVQQWGLGAIKKYPIIGSELAAANVAQIGLKSGVNALNDKPVFTQGASAADVPGAIIQPFYNNETPAKGDLGQFALNLINTPAATFSGLHGLTTAGILTNGSPYKNVVVESLQHDNSPGNVEQIKAQLKDIGEKKGWTEDEINNTQSTVDALADVAGKIPKDIAPGKFHQAIDIIMKRRTLEAVLKEANAKTPELDPAFTDQVEPFKELLTAKIEKENDNLAELIKEKKFTYSFKEGKYYKTMAGGEPEEITKARYDLEKIKSETPQEPVETKNIGEPEAPARSEPAKPAQPTPKKPAVDTEALDELDNELEGLKQEEAPAAETAVNTPSDVKKAETPENTPPPIEKKITPVSKESFPADSETSKVDKHDVSKFINEDADLIKPKSANIVVVHKNKDGDTYALIVAKSQTGDDIAAVRQIDKNGDQVLGLPDNGWKTQNKAKEYFESLTNTTVNEKPTNVPTEQGGVEPKPEAPAEADKQGSEVQSNDEAQKPVVKPELRPAAEGHGLERPYYIAKAGEEGKPEHEKVEGKPVANDAGLDLFVHARDGDFAVSEGSTGLKIADGATEKEAIANAHTFISTHTPEGLKKLIANQYDRGIKSPRGIIEPANTENTEAVIAKAATTVRKAKAVSGSVSGSEAEEAIKSIDESIGEIDKELDKLGYDPSQPPPGAEEQADHNAEREQRQQEKTEDKERQARAGRRAEQKAKVKEKLDAAKRAFIDSINKATSGLDPETLAKGLKMMKLYAEAGILNFRDIAEDLAIDLGEKFRDIFDALKASYLAYGAEATEAEAEIMDNLRDVRKANINDFLEPITDGTRSKPATLDENTSGVATGVQPGITTGTAQGEQAETLPSQQDGGSGENGNAVEISNQTKQRPGTGRSNPAGAGTGNGSGGTEPDNGDIGQPVQRNTKERVVKPEDQNHVIKPGDVIVPTGAVGKFNANLDALLLLKKLESEDRNPTPAEKKQLAQFVGWGGLGKYLAIPYEAKRIEQAVSAYLNGKNETVYDQGYNRRQLNFADNGPVDVSKFNSISDLIDDIRKALVNSGYSISPDDIRAPLVKSLLTPSEYQDAINSTINAHYTEREIISKMWDIVNTLGFKGGRILEPSAGIGHFFGLLPEELRNKTSLQGYELDSVTGRLLKKLYPQANITVGGFEHSRVPQNSIDLAISNVPFAASAPYDKNFPELSKFSMHNYFIAKNLKLLKPGGIAVMITSSSTMDSAASGKFREWVTNPEGGNSYLVGAIRLPNNAFDENAGTQVTTDMLVFQKKGQVVNSELEQPFRYTKQLTEGKDSEGNVVPIHVNEYYIDHPNQMLGDMMTAHEAGSGGLYGSDSATLKFPAGRDFTKSLNAASDIFPKDIAGNKTVAIEHDEQPITATDKKEGSLFAKDNKIYRVEDGDGKPVELTPKQSQITKGYIDLKDGLLNLISLEQAESNPEANIEAQRKELNKDYDAFIKKHGNVNSRAVDFLNDLDIDFPLVSSLENISRRLETTNGKDRFIDIITKGEILTKRINFPRIEPKVATDINDAMNISLNFRSGLDLNYMGRMLGEDPEAIRERLLKEDMAYENPDTGILETPEEYLSGFVRDKLRKAEIASHNDSKYLKNVTELKKIIPEDIPSALISYSLGSSWIPAHVYEGFGAQIFNTPIKVKYLPAAGKFLISGYKYSAAIQNTYAAGGQDGLTILDATLNNRQMIVSDTVEGVDGVKRQIKNVEKTAAAQAMQAQLQAEFEAYVRGNEAVQTETERIYNDVYNGQVNRTFRIPDFKHYPGASTTVILYDHQKRAISRGLAESTLFAHEVGSGKTFTIITTAMEMRRLGTARKPVIVVQNATLGQVVTSFKKLYPSAKILAPSKKEMQADGRKKLFAKIATGDWDAIILPHSQITMIPDDPERQKAYILEQIEEMKSTMDTIGDARERNKIANQIKLMVKEMDAIDGNVSEDDDTGGGKRGGKSAAKKAGEKALKIEAGMQKILDRKVDNVLNFEQLGIDAMLVDEAHAYKKLGFQTAMNNIKGIDTGKSQRSQSILLKSRWIQEKTGGKNVNFYTGTPISNTMAEAWTMMRYLRPDILQHLGIEYFDQFAKTFGQVVPSLEQTAGGTFKIQNRFAKFQNLPEFINAFKTVTDVVLSDDVKEFQNSDLIPKMKGGKPTLVVIQQSPELKKQIAQFRETLEWFDKLSGKEKREYSYIPLVTYTQAKKASIDLRLLDPSNVDSPESKTNQSVKKVFEIWKNGKEGKLTQMIFSDLYQSPEPKSMYLDEDGQIVNNAYGKERFNLFEDIKKKLVALGIPAEEIAIITDAKYDKVERKELLFDDFKAGKVRVALGTTQKMGIGVNAQTKLVALHNLDAPARPMDMIQRVGRIQRQGNENKEIEVLNYGVEKTLDASAYQTLATKEGFIKQIMKGENLDRVTEDAADETSMGFEEMMAHLSDSPYAMQKLMVDNKLNTERMKQQNFNHKLTRTNSYLRDNERELVRDKSRLQDEIKNAETVRAKFPDNNIISLKASNQPEATEKFGEAADTYIKMLLDKFESSPTHYAKGFFTLNGVNVELEVTDKEIMSDKTHLVVHTPRLKYTMPEIGLLTDRHGMQLEIDSRSGTGLLSSIRSQLDNILVRPAKTQNDINNTETDIIQLKKDAQAKFDDSRLQELQKESDALKEKMIADGNKKKPDDDGDGMDDEGGGDDDKPVGPFTGGVRGGVFDHSNIQGALDFLENAKAKTGGKLMGTIIPIPPAVWNSAIDVMKGVLKATNSTQKAIRIAAKYIVDSGGSDAQSKDFMQTMNDKLAGTNTAKKATVADTEDAMTPEQMISGATMLQNKIKTVSGLSPDEKALAGIDLQSLTKKELHRYIEISAVLAADPNGVLTKDVNDLFSRVNNRVNPKMGTAVPPGAGGPPPPTGTTTGGDDEPEFMRVFTKKENSGIDGTIKKDKSDEKPESKAKENYSVIGNAKDIHVRNLEQLKMFGRDISNMESLRAAIQSATSDSQARIAIKIANDKITKLIGDDGYETLRQALIESRLRGTRQRYIDWSRQFKNASDNDIDDLFSSGPSSAFYGILGKMQGYEEDENPQKTILTMIDNGDYDDARQYISDIFENAAGNVAYYNKLANGKTFDEMVSRDADGNYEFNNSKFQDAHQVYKDNIEKPFKESHASNDGIFSDALGPLNTYYPLSPTGMNEHRVYNPSKSTYNAPSNINNRFTTGLADEYSSEITDLSHKMSASLKTNNKAALIDSLQAVSLMAKVSEDNNDNEIIIRGITYKATKVAISQPRTILGNGQVINMPARYMLIPNFLYKEIKPIIEGEEISDQDKYSIMGHVLNLAVNIMLGGPGEAISHSYRLLSGITNSMPFMQEWAYKNGVLGQAGGIIANNILVKKIGGIAKVLSINTSSDEFASDVQEMAKLGLIPEKTWTHTWSKQFAEAMGVEKTHLINIPLKDLKAGNYKIAVNKFKLFDFSPMLYGKNGFDLKARVTMYRLVKAMNPEATPEDHVRMQADMGQYTTALQGRVEKFIKRHGLAPFATFGRTMRRAGIKSILGITQLPLDNADFGDFFKGTDGGSKARKFVYYKALQLITNGIVGYVALWMLWHKVVTNKWPMDDPDARFSKLPLPDWAKHTDFARKYFYNERTKTWDDIDMAWFNPQIARGFKAVGVEKGYNTHKQGGTIGQSIESGTVQAVNSATQPYTNSPLISIPITTISGAAPYITGIRDFKGKADLSLLHKSLTQKPGMQVPANFLNSMLGLNPLFENLNPATGLVNDQYNEDDYESGKLMKSIINIATPNLASPHGDPKKSHDFLEKQNKAIETTIKKESGQKRPLKK